jgi:hypothetical protein
VILALTNAIERVRGRPVVKLCVIGTVGLEHRSLRQRGGLDSGRPGRLPCVCADLGKTHHA